MTTIRYGRPPTRELPELPPAHGRHGRAGAARRTVHALPRPTLRSLLVVAGLAEFAAAIGWIAGYGASPSGAVLAFNAALLLVLAGVRS